MFSMAEKQRIAEAVEKVLLEIDHPEMPKEKPVFKLHVDGKEAWSYADIEPNWKYDDTNKPETSIWNEMSREFMKD